MVVEAARPLFRHRAGVVAAGAARPRRRRDAHRPTIARKSAVPELPTTTKCGEQGRFPSKVGLYSLIRICCIIVYYRVLSAELPKS